MFSLDSHDRGNNFFLFVEQLSDAVVYLSRDYEILYRNTAAGTLLDTQALDLLVSLCKDKQEHVSVSGSWTQTLDYLLAGGNHLKLKVHIIATQANDCYPTGFIITCKGVEKSNQTAHHQFLPYFETFMKHLPALAWITDEQFIVHYFNGECKNSFQISGDKVGCSFEQLFPSTLFIDNKKISEQVFSLNKMLETIEEGVDGKGEKCVYKVYRFLISSNESKKLLGAIALDITGLLKQQQELESFKEYFRFVNKAISDSIWDWDIVVDKVYRGEGYSNLSGSSNISFSMEQHFQYIHIKDRKKVVKSLEDALENRKDYWQEEYRCLSKDGTYRDIIDKGYIIHNKEGKPVRMIGAMEDVSQNRRLEKVLIEKEEAKKKEIIKAIIEAQEKERTQISYELHEQLSQNLATCKLLLDGLHFPETKEEERIRLRSSMKLLTQTMNEIRSMSHQLNANAIKMVGLVGVMRDLTSTVNQNWQVEVLLQCNGFSDTTVLPKDIEVSAFRIFQEGMNNVIRHSGATQATVQLTKKHKWLILSINDNGKGFDVATTSKGLGFTNIINRVDYHNRKVSICSSEGNGCTLEVRLPVMEKGNEK